MGTNNAIYSPGDALRELMQGNKRYVNSRTNQSDISPSARKRTAEHGQKPYAVILTCSDSRMPPEHIFSAGIGDLYVVRTAGNVVGDFELGSIEYGVETLGAKIIVVMGHSECAAVAKALEDQAEGSMEDIIYEIQLGLRGETDECAAIEKNIRNSKKRILESERIRSLLYTQKIMLACAKYDMASGSVDFFEY